MWSPLVSMVLAATLSQGTGRADTPPRSPSVLIIGDSHATSTFGKSLDLLLRSVDAEVTTVGSCGVSPDAFLRGLSASCGFLRIETGEPDWRVVKLNQASTPRLEELLGSAAPTLTIVELGANQIHSAWRNPAEASDDIAALADTILASGSACLWVGPPSGRDNVKPHAKVEYLYGLLEKSLQGRCKLVDSRPSALPFLDYERLAPRSGDGRHWDAIGIEGQQAARRWALEVFKVAVPLLERTRPAHDDGRVAVSAASSPESSRRALDLRFRHELEVLEGSTDTVELAPAQLPLAVPEERSISRSVRAQL
ncbi:MAG: hypothetical protein ACO3JL_09685 [Myxococcota bacterium]